jgi:hypothetical protein
MAISVPQWSLKLVAAFLCVCVVSLVAVGAAGARDKYPAQVKSAFVGSCVKAATSGGNVTKKKAKAYCTSAFNCIQRKLTLKQFEKAANNNSGQNNKKIKACEKAALKKL